jgi:hypothetical protein
MKDALAVVDRFDVLYQNGRTEIENDLKRALGMP